MKKPNSPHINYNQEQIVYCHNVNKKANSKEAK